MNSNYENMVNWIFEKWVERTADGGVCDMGLQGFFKKWAKVPESVDFTGFVAFCGGGVVFLIWKS